MKPACSLFRLGASIVVQIMMMVKSMKIMGKCIGYEISSFNLLMINVNSNDNKGCVLCGNNIHEKKIYAYVLWSQAQHGEYEITCPNGRLSSL